MVHDERILYFLQLDLKWVVAAMQQLICQMLGLEHEKWLCYMPKRLCNYFFGPPCRLRVFWVIFYRRKEKISTPRFSYGSLEPQIRFQLQPVGSRVEALFMLPLEIGWTRCFEISYLGSWKKFEAKHTLNVTAYTTCRGADDGFRVIKPLLFKWCEKVSWSLHRQ